jgi:hypothetical protein
MVLFPLKNHLEDMPLRDPRRLSRIRLAIPTESSITVGVSSSWRPRHSCVSIFDVVEEGAATPQDLGRAMPSLLSIYAQKSINI